MPMPVVTSLVRCSPSTRSAKRKEVQVVEQPKIEVPPGGWAALQWHRDPNSKRYRSRQTAERACRWLNSHEHPGDEWLFRPGPVDPDGRVRLERRWVGG